MSFMIFQISKTSTTKTAFLGGSPVDIPEEGEDDADLGVNNSCGESNDEASRELRREVKTHRR